MPQLPHGVLADLETLYRQAQAVYWPFQRKVLALAAVGLAFHLGLGGPFLLLPILLFIAAFARNQATTLGR